MISVLFVCTENAFRSQMAEAFARMHAADVLQPESAGSEPSGSLDPLAVELMRDRGYDLRTHRSKSLDAFAGAPRDLVILMGCGDACPWVPARSREDWGLPSPHGMSMDDLRALRDEIERRVLDLAARLRKGA